MTALKKAEEGDDLILRAYETNKAETEAEISLPKLGKSVKARFRPCEIKTFRFPADGSEPVEVNLIEDPV